MLKSCSFASLAVGAVVLGLAAVPASAATFPNIGNATGGPYGIIQISGGGGGPLVGTLVAGSGQAYDTGGDDVYYGIENLTSATTIFNISLSGGGIFGFDGDGIGAGPYPGPGGCTTAGPCTTPSAVDNSGGGYGGPSSYFQVTDSDDGSVFFSGGILPGDSTFFALEAPASTVSVTGVHSTTPLPAALPLFAGGLGLMGLVARGRKRKAAKA